MVGLQDGSFIRRRLVRVEGKYPWLVYKEEIKTVKQGSYQVVSQTGMVADEVIVKLAAGVSVDELADIADQNDATVVRKLLVPGHYLLKLNRPELGGVEKVLHALSSAGNVSVYAEPNYIYSTSLTPNDSQWPLWGMQQVSAPAAWDQTTGEDSILVAVIDSGVDASHSDLAGNMWVNAGETGLDSENNDKKTNGIDDDNNGFIDDWQGWNFYGSNNDPADDNDHGTHCAGTVGAVGNNSIGVAGVCWNVSLVGIKFLGADGYGSEVDAAEAVLYATQLGAVIQNHSWGGSAGGEMLLSAFEAANSNGVLAVVAAGNSNNDNDTAPVYPASYDLPNIIAVAASDEDDRLASFSNYGSATVDLAAPGVDIVSTIPGDAYDSFQGTSMAAPHVAGAAALLWGANSGLGCLDVKAAIINSTDKIPALTGKTLSGGRLNVYAMMSAAQDTDGDGMPDDWETEHNLNKNLASDAEEDDDGDHLTNLDEYRNGTDPNDSDTDGDSLVDGWEVTYGFSPLSVTGQLSSIERTGFSTGDEAMDVVVTNGYAYVADGEAGLLVIDVSNPSAPVRSGACDTEGFAAGVAVAGNYAYMADGTNGLVVIDISTPQIPIQIGHHSATGSAVRVAVDSGVAYVVSGDDGLSVFNVSNPSNIVKTASKYAPGTGFYDVCVFESSLYLASVERVIQLDKTTLDS
ncbi:MAG: S8 family serine peptidase, partial [Kiritimatiellales bacterium]